MFKASSSFFVRTESSNPNWAFTRHACQASWNRASTHRTMNWFENTVLVRDDKLPLTCSLGTGTKFE